PRDRLRSETGNDHDRNDRTGGSEYEPERAEDEDALQLRRMTEEFSIHKCAVYGNEQKDNDGDCRDCGYHPFKVGKNAFGHDAQYDRPLAADADGYDEQQ